jgi:hypothetical protein
MRTASLAGLVLVAMACPANAQYADYWLDGNSVHESCVEGYGLAFASQESSENVGEPVKPIAHKNSATFQLSL